MAFSARSTLRASVCPPTTQRCRGRSSSPVLSIDVCRLSANWPKEGTQGFDVPGPGSEMQRRPAVEVPRVDIKGVNV